MSVGLRRWRRSNLERMPKVVKPPVTNASTSGETACACDIQMTSGFFRFFPYDFFIGRPWFVAIARWRQRWLALRYRKRWRISTSSQLGVVELLLPLVEFGVVRVVVLRVVTPPECGVIGTFGSDVRRRST